MIKLLFYFFSFIFVFYGLEAKKNSGYYQKVDGKFIRYQENDFSIKLKARKFKRSELMFVKIEPKHNGFNPEKYSLRWLNKVSKLYPFQNGYATLLPISPTMREGQNQLVLLEKTDNGFIEKKYPVVIEKTIITPSKRKKINSLKLSRKYDSKRKMSKELLSFIQKCTEAKEKAFQSNTDLRIEGGFQYPLSSIYITSHYNAVRTYYKRNRKPHRGIDFRAKTGTPIYAIEAGTVVLSQRMYFEGIFTIVDHGDEMFSLYMHQSDTNVKEGDIVKKGDIIGKVGATGMATGPHLHLGLKVKGSFLNPMSAIDLKLD